MYTSLQDVKTFVRSNYAVANVYMREHYTEVTTKEQAIDSIALGGTLGGNLGLCIGASLMTWVRQFVSLFCFLGHPSLVCPLIMLSLWCSVVSA